MDLSNRTRHTHRATARLREEVRGEGNVARAHMKDLLRGRGQTAQSLDPLPVLSETGMWEAAGCPPEVDPGSQESCTTESRAQTATPLALLADEITEQAESSHVDELREARLQSVRRALAESVTQRTAAAPRTPADAPGELLRAFREAIETSSPPSAPSPLVPEFVPPHSERSSDFRPRSKSCPRVEVLVDGQRIEYFDNESEISKDALGRVTEVKSSASERVSFQYDSCGNLDSFVRTDGRGSPHSDGRRDKHGIVVRDPEGRVRAAGESMTVDPLGCLCIHNFDGQFVSIDLVRGLHIERRRLPDSQGRWQMVTAVFAHDGFRMACQFYDCAAMYAGAGTGGLSSRPYRVSADANEGDVLRFYGRDGSLVEFDAEEELRRLRPARVLAPGSVHVDTNWRGKHQAGTAWGAVREYLEIICCYCSLSFFLS